MPLRLIFMGTPDFAVPTLVELVDAGHEIAAVYTRAPKPGGRGMGLQETPVARQAHRSNIAVRTPKSLRDIAEQADFASLKADAAVVVAYGLILPKAILEAVPLGCFNLHASLLPRWRGAAPINRAVMAGDAQSGACVMRMDEGLDTGPVAMMESILIGPDGTAGDLHDRLAISGAGLMQRAIADLESGTLKLKPQPEIGVTYAQKIDKAETRIDWNKPAQEVHNHIRGLSPFPGAWFELAGEGEPARIKVLRTTLAAGRGEPGKALDDNLTIACGDGAIHIVELQRAGRQPMKASQFLRGHPVKAGTHVS
ncbi:MAG: methionyl-tRNA formyltransferase [Pseudorhodoplanes sp.]